MSEKPHNPPAFPCEAQGDRNVPPEHDYIQTGIYSSKLPGMSLRDYFAGQALTGMLASGATVDIVGGHIFQARARSIYMIADAMLAERERQS